MDSLPYDNIDQLSNCLYLTFRGRGDEVKQASEYLGEMAKDITRFATSLMNLVTCDRSDQNFLEIKSSACSILSTSLKEVILREVLTPEIKNFLLEVIIKSLFHSNVALKTKISLTFTLEELFKTDTGVGLRNKSLQFIISKLGEGSLNDYASSFLVLQKIVKSPRLSKDALVDFFKKVREPLVIAVNNIIQGIVAELKAAVAENSSDKIENVFNGLRVLRTFVLTIKNCIDAMGKRKKNEPKVKLYSSYMQAIIAYDPLVQVLSTILTLQVPSEKQLPMCLFSTSGITGVDEILNGIKGDTLACFNRVLDFANKFNTLLNTGINKFLAFAMDSGIKGVLQSILVFCENENLDFDGIPKDEELNDCIVESLRFLALLASQAELNDLYVSFHKRLIVNVCLPLIRTTQHEMDKFENDPFDFVQLSADTCADQLSAVAKTQAVHLLDHLCDFVDGAVSFVAMHLYSVMEYSLLCNNIEEIPSKYPSLNDFTGCLLIRASPPKIRLETCLLALTSLSYHVAQRSDLVENLETFMANYKNVFYADDTDPLIKARMCLFIGYFMEVLFLRANAREFFGMQLKFLIDCLAERGDARLAISEQAVDSLSTIFRQNELRNLIGPFLPDVIEKLGHYIEFADNSVFYDVIEKLFTIFRKRLTENPNFIGILITQMVKRIHIECATLKQNGKKAESQILNRIWGIIQIISEDESFIPKLQVDIEKLLEPLLPYLDDNAPFEDELIHYVGSVTSIAKNVSEFCWNVVKTFPRMFETCKLTFGPLFTTINQVVIHGKELFNKDSDSVKVFVNMGIQGLNPTHKKTVPSDVCEAALLLQLLIQYSQAITPQDMEALIVACLQKLNQDLKGYVKAKVAGVVLTAFIYHFELTYKVVTHEGIMKNFLTLALDNAADFDHQYDQKVLLLGLCNMLIQGGIKDEDIHDKLFQIFNVLISFLRFAEAMEQKAAATHDEEEKRPLTRRQKLVQYLSTRDDSEFPAFRGKQFAEDNVENQVSFPAGTGYDEDTKNNEEDDDDDEDYDGYVSDPDEKEALKISNKFESDLIHRDEFAIFKQALFSIKEIDGNILKELFEWLPTNKKGYLQDVLNTQRVIVDMRDGNPETEARKIQKVRARKVAQNVIMGNNMNN